MKFEKKIEEDKGSQKINEKITKKKKKKIRNGGWKSRVKGKLRIRE